jgi:hypothetical protein
MVQSYWGNPATRTFAELLIDCEEIGRYAPYWWRSCVKARCAGASG